MQFESDPRESERNFPKHGIDFKAAQALWDDLRLLQAQGVRIVGSRVVRCALWSFEHLSKAQLRL